MLVVVWETPRSTKNAFLCFALPCKPEISIWSVAFLSASTLLISYDVSCDGYSSRLGLAVQLADPPTEWVGWPLAGRRISFAQLKPSRNTVFKTKPQQGLCPEECGFSLLVCRLYHAK